MNDDELADDDLDVDPFEDGAARTPVHVVGRIIARSPVGVHWCGFIDQCGSPGRAERGQAYVRAGAVVDLKVRPGCITASVYLCAATMESQPITRSALAVSTLVV